MAVVVSFLSTSFLSTSFLSTSFLSTSSAKEVAVSSAKEVAVSSANEVAVALATSSAVATSFADEVDVAINDVFSTILFFERYGNLDIFVLGMPELSTSKLDIIETLLLNINR